MTNHDNTDVDVEIEDIDQIDESADGAEDGFAAPAKKSGGFLFKFIIIVGVMAAGGFFAARQFGVTLPFMAAGPAVPPQPASAPETQTAETAPALADPLAPAPENPEIPADPLAEAAMSAPVRAVSEQDAMLPAPLGDMPDMQPTAPAEERNIEDVAAGLPAQPAPADAAPEASAETSDPLAWSDAPAADGVTAGGAAETAETIAETPAGTPAETPGEAFDPGADPAAPALASPVDTAAIPESAPAATASGVTEDPATLGKIEELETRLTAIEQALADIRDASVTKEDIAALKNSLEKARPARETSAPKQRKAKPAAPAAVSTRWILKSAKPGMAWVSEQGSSELRTVSVGDTLSGIGNITAISLDSSGRWVVNGTKGRINQ